MKQQMGPAVIAGPIRHNPRARSLFGQRLLLDTYLLDTYLLDTYLLDTYLLDTYLLDTLT